MLPKIRFRLVYNYANRLNKQCLAPIAIECIQGCRKLYISTKVLIAPYKWYRGIVINHQNAEKLTAYCVKYRNKVEEVELNALLKGRHMSLGQLKMAIKYGIHQSANLKDFTIAVIENSDRKESTKRGYEYLMNEIDEDYDSITLDDITYDWVLRWRQKMMKSNLSENTVKGRMKMLKAITNEALKHDLIDESPFKFITIGSMTAKEVWLNMKEIKNIENVPLKGKQALVRVLFILGCYCGLRWSDLSTLEEAEIKDGMLKKMMKKTSHEVHIPIKTLFWGNGMEIIEKYSGNIKRLSHCCCNASANKMIKEIARKACVNKPVSFHWARKSCSSNLQLLGMSLSEVSTILGHADIEVTNKHYSFSKDESAAKSSSRIFKQKVDHDTKNMNKKVELSMPIS